MSKKTERKNRTNLVVKWPSAPFFTLQEVFDLQKEAKQITLRVRLTKQIEAGTAAEIGCKRGGQGRPKKVFAFTPVSQATLELAKSKNVELVAQTELDKLVVPVTVFTPHSVPVTA